MTDSSRDTPAEPQAPCYQLTYDSAAGLLVGAVLANPPTYVSAEHLKPKIKALGCENFYFAPDSIDHFLQKLKTGTLGKYALGEARDASISITVSSDKLSARAKTTAAFGGATLSLKSVSEALKSAKINSHCIQKSQIKQLLKATKPIDIIIAKALLPEHGRDARFIPLVKSTIAITKDTDNNRAIDQHEAFDFVVVEPGKPLMLREPATRGIDGLNVIGGSIKATPGKDKAYAKPLQGVELNPSDNNILQAQIKGHPVISTDGMRVDPIMTVKAVDIHSGNIHYDGSLFVQQDIQSGYTVEVTGDIIVKGSIFEATLLAGGNIIAGGGVHTKIEEDDSTCRLSAKGDIRAKFFYQSHVCSGGDVHAREYIMQSHIQSGGSVYAGLDGGKGAIIGGQCDANQHVHAKVLGNDAYLATKITVGANQPKHPELIPLKKKIQRRYIEQKQLDDILEKIKHQEPPAKVGQVTLDRVRKIEETLSLIRQQITDLECRLADIAGSDQSEEHRYVSIDNCAYLNVHIVIEGVSWQCTEIKRRFKVQLIQHALKVEPLT